MKIYTKKGDRGQTTLFSGKTVPKNDPFIESLGNIDELNCAIGVALASIPKDTTLGENKKQLIFIQNALFDLGASVATPVSSSKEEQVKKTRFDKESVAKIESWIDALEENLPPLKTFILPGGHPSGAALHLARSICRRVERSILPLLQQKDIAEEVAIFLNRLSDYLFVLSRFVNHELKSQETLWHQNATFEECSHFS